MPAAYEKVSFAAQTLVEGQAQVKGELSIPAHAQGKLPAVVVLHSANGIDGTGKRYIDALNAAGMATLELDLFASSRGRPPRSTRMNLPQVYGSALYLAHDPRIDASRIGVMGFSWEACCPCSRPRRS